MTLPTWIASGTIVATATNGATLTPASPAGAIGDLLILVLERQDGTAAPTVTGWTNIASATTVSSTLHSVATYWKIAASAAAGGDNPSAITFGTSTVLRAGRQFRFRSTSATAPIHLSSILATVSTATTVNATNITSTIANTTGVFLAVMIGARSTTNTTTNWPAATGVTAFASANDTTGNDSTFGIGVKQFAAAGSYLTPGIVWSTNTTTGPGMAVLLALREDQPPNAATSTAATSLTGTSFTANWTAPATDSTHDAADGYYLEVATDSGFTSHVSTNQNYGTAHGTATGFDAGNVLTFSVTGLTPGQAYWYRVWAYNANGGTPNAAASSAQNLTTPALRSRVTWAQMTAPAVITTPVAAIDSASLNDRSSLAANLGPTDTSSLGELGTTTVAILASDTPAGGAGTYDVGTYGTATSDATGPSLVTDQAQIAFSPRVVDVTTLADTATVVVATGSTSVAATDTATLSDTTGIAAGLAVATDTATGQDTASAAAGLTAQDSSAFSDATPLVSSTLAVPSDLSLFGDQALISFAPKLVDVATLADSATVGTAQLSTADSGSLAESAQVASTPAVATDAATLADTATVSVSLLSTDTGTLADQTTSSVSLRASDAASEQDAASIGLPVSDASSLGDQLAISSPLLVTDTSAELDTSSISASLSTQDSGTLSDTPAASASLTASDPAVLTDLGLTIAAALLSRDTAVEQDSLGSPTLAAVDVGTLSEGQPGLAATVLATDGATLADAASVAIAGSTAISATDAASLSESARIAATLSAPVDAAVTADTLPAIAVNVTDAGTAQDATGAALSTAPVLYDAGTLTETTASLTVALGPLDGASLSDTTAPIPSAISLVDSAAASDQPPVVAVSARPTDSATLAEGPGPFPTVTLAAVDNGTLSEAASVGALGSVPVSASDAASLSETLSIVASISVPPDVLLLQDGAPVNLAFTVGDGALTQDTSPRCTASVATADQLLLAMSMSMGATVAGVDAIGLGDQYADAFLAIEQAAEIEQIGLSVSVALLDAGLMSEQAVATSPAFAVPFARDALTFSESIILRSTSGAMLLRPQNRTLAAAGARSTHLTAPARDHLISAPTRDRPLIAPTRDRPIVAPARKGQPPP